MDQQVQMNLDPLNLEAVRLAVRAGLQRELDAANALLTQQYEGQLLVWKGDANRAAGEIGRASCRERV